MKFAYFSPFPPKQTGISTYSSHLVPALRKVLALDCYDFDNEAAGNPSVTFGDFAAGGNICALSSYASVVYHLGNNPHYHLAIYRTLRQFPGIVVLHDVVLYYLFAGLGRNGLIKHFLLNYSITQHPELKTLLADCPGGDLFRYPTPEKYPLVASVFPFARGIIVHNHFAERLLIAAGYSGPIHVISHLSYHFGAIERKHAVGELRSRLGGESGEILIGCFGFIGRTKRMAQLCQALTSLKGKLSFRFLIVGEGEDVGELLDAGKLAKQTICTRFVDEDEFTDYLACTDIVVNLRYPSMGESSGTLTQAMSLGKACIVTNDASFRELPDDAVVKINVSDTEVKDLADAISALARDPKKRATLGRAARAFTEAKLNPEAIATQFCEVLEVDAKQRARERLLADAEGIGSVELARDLLNASLDARLPRYLR